MLLVLDIGNTSVTVGGFAHEPETLWEPCFIEHFPTDPRLDTDCWKTHLTTLVKNSGLMNVSGDIHQNIDGCILCSVVPELTPKIRAALEEMTGYAPLVVDADFDDGLILAGYQRKKLGNDRIVDAVGALAQYSPPLAIFDLGTATTLSVLDQHGRFIGGMIQAGLRLSVQALAAQTAQLPEVTLEAPQSFLGTDTVSCIRNGVIYGTAAMIDGLSRRIASHLGQKTQIILTGGMGKLVAPYCQQELHYDEYLILKGLRTLYQRYVQIHP